MIPGMPDYMGEEPLGQFNLAMVDHPVCPRHGATDYNRGACWTCVEENFRYEKAIEMFAPELRGC